MLKWIRSLFNSKNEEVTLNINVNITGTLDVKTESNGEGKISTMPTEESIVAQDKPADTQGPQRTNELPTADRFSRLQKPAVNFGTEE